MFLAVTLLYAGAIAGLARWFPGALAPLAGVALVAIAVAWFWSRDNYGRRAQLPPGSLLPMLMSPWLDRFHFMKLWQRHGPVFKTSHFFHPLVCVMTLEKGLDLLRHHDDVRLLSPKVPTDRFIPCGFLHGMDPVKHKLYRPLTQSLITPEVLTDCETFVAEQLESTLGTIAHECARAPQGVFTMPHWDRFLYVAFTRIFWGLTPDSPQFAEVRRLYDIIDLASQRRIAASWLPSNRRTRQAYAALTALLTERSEEISSAIQAGQPWPRCFLSELVQKHPQHTGDPAALGILISMLRLASNDVIGLFQWLVKKLCDYPAVSRQLREELDAKVSQRESGSLANRMILETLRQEQMEHLYRRILEDFEWDGYRMRKGWMLRICVWEAHRDPAHFPNPEHFDPGRFIPERFKREGPEGQSLGQRDYLPFGTFRRACIGEPVAKAMGRQLLCSIAANWECRQIGSSEVTLDGWHWTPGPAFRVELKPREASAQG